MAIEALELQVNRKFLRTELREKEAELRLKQEEIKKRGELLEKSLKEMETREEKELVDKELEEFKIDKAKVKSLEDSVKRIYDELDELDDKIKKLEEETTEKVEKETIEVGRGGVPFMDHRATKFFGMTRSERDTFIQQPEIQELLGNVRKIGKRSSDIQNIQLTIPETMLELIRQKTSDFSKLLNHTRVVQLKGKGRQRIAGEPSEAVWTEMCASTNELSFGFNDVEVDGFMVSGFFAICNAILEDNDVNLTSELIEAIGKSIGRAIDRAILFGKGIKMPLGFVTRLAQTAKPSDYSATDREWVDLSSKNIKTISATDSKGSKLFASLLDASSAMDNDYDDGQIFWAMNKKTYNYIRAQALTFDSSGVIVAKVGDEMPIIGGKIEVLSKGIVKDYEIYAGYDRLYLTAERAGMRISQSEHVRFLENQTLIKGNARYDGIPVIAEGFMAIGINGTTPSTSSTFPPDKANEKETTEETDGDGE